MFVVIKNIIAVTYIEVTHTGIEREKDMTKDKQFVVEGRGRISLLIKHGVLLVVRRHQFTKTSLYFCKINPQSLLSGSEKLFVFKKKVASRRWPWPAWR